MRFLVLGLDGAKMTKQVLPFYFGLSNLGAGGYRGDGPARLGLR